MKFRKLFVVIASMIAFVPAVFASSGVGEFSSNEQYFKPSGLTTECTLGLAEKAAKASQGTIAMPTVRGKSGAQSIH